MPNSHILQRLSEPLTLERRLQSLAVLTEILSWDLGEPQVSFDCHWRKKARRAIIDNYQGDRVYTVFSSAGALLEGSVHDCWFAKDKVLAQTLRKSVPDVLQRFVDDALIDSTAVTFNGWLLAGDLGWSAGGELPTCENDLDGADCILSIVEGGPESFQEWAEENYERDIDVLAVEHIYMHNPLSEDIVRRLNPSVTLGQAASELARIGYPSQSFEKALRGGANGK